VLIILLLLVAVLVVEKLRLAHSPAAEVVLEVIEALLEEKLLVVEVIL
jgi:hypothetical protein